MEIRDILLYFLWETGLYTNRQIGNLFDVTYSAVSRRVHITKSRISKHNVIRRKCEHLKSLIKGWPHLHRIPSSGNTQIPLIRGSPHFEADTVVKCALSMK